MNEQKFLNEGFLQRLVFCWLKKVLIDKSMLKGDGPTKKKHRETELQTTVCWYTMQLALVRSLFLDVVCEVCKFFLIIPAHFLLMFFSQNQCHNLQHLVQDVTVCDLSFKSVKLR